MLILDRFYLPDRTDGVFHGHHGLSWPVLELPWRGNQPRISCIPEGRYTLRRDWTGKHQWFRIADDEVGPIRSDIELHIGKKTSHSLGCILFPEWGPLWTLVGQVPASEVLWIRSDSGVPEFTMET